MKTIKLLYIIIIALLSCGQLHAAGSDMRETTDTWMQSSNRGITRTGGLIGDDENPDGNLNRNDTSIQDGLIFLLLLSGVYIFVGKRKEIIQHAIDAGIRSY